jgi:hypothetical protein
MLNQPLWASAGAIALSEKVMSPALGMKALKGARQGLLPEQTKQTEPQKKTGVGWWDKAKNFGSQAVSGVIHMGQKGLKQGAAAVKSMSDSGQQALSTVVGLPSKAGHALAHGVQTVGTRAQHRAQALASKAFKGASDLTQAGQQQSESMWHKALQHGQKVFKGTVDYADKHKNQVAIAAATITPFGAALSPDAKKFTEAIPGWIDKHVDLLTKGRAQIVQNAIKPLEHIPVVGKAAQAFAWFDNKMGEFGGGVLKGAGSLVGGVLNIVTHPVETATGLYAMAEHVPFMAGLVPNPLKLAHAGADIIFNGADPKARMETVMDPGKSLQDDAKFGKALVDGFVEPYKKSWAEGKYFEVAGRATFDIGSLFIGAGEANAAIKTGEVASVAAKTAEVASVASKTGEVASVASKTAEVANVASKTGEVANVASKSGKAAEVASTTGKATEVSNVASKTSEVALTTEKMTEVASDAGKASKSARGVAGKTEKGAEGASKTGKTAESARTSGGHRRSPYEVLTPEEITKLTEEFKELGGNPDKLRFNKGAQTSYADDLDKVNVRGDVNPLEGEGINHPRSTMTTKAVLAHELGHQAHRGTKVPIGAWNDEFRASYWAAKNLPNLTLGNRPREVSQRSPFEDY